MLLNDSFGRRAFRRGAKSATFAETTEPAEASETGRQTPTHTDFRQREGYCVQTQYGSRKGNNNESWTEATKENGCPTEKEPRPKKASERYMTLKTNIAYDAIAVPNLSFEIQCSKHISVELPVMFSGWDISHQHAVRTFAVQPEGRWWLEKAGTGHFFGVHAHMALFNVKWDENRYQNTGRPLLGAGVSYGYKLPFSKHWGAEFTLGAGYANMKYNTYYNIDNGALIETKSRNYWGITRLGISLSYRF